MKRGWEMIRVQLILTANFHQLWADSNFDESWWKFLLVWPLRPVYTCNFCCDFRCDFLLMDVNEWMSYECSDEGTYTQNIHNSSTRSYTSEEENRTWNRSKNCLSPDQTRIWVDESCNSRSRLTASSHRLLCTFIILINFELVQIDNLHVRLNFDLGKKK